MRRLRSTALVTVAVLACLAVASCSNAGAYEQTPLPENQVSTTTTTPTSPTPTTTTPPNPDIVAANCLKSYAPPATMPSPGDMPAGSTMARIKARGRLIAGVSADTLLLGSRNPVSGEIEGFDIDMLHAVSQAIFNNPDKIEPRVITSAQREPLLKAGSVDIVARNMTINCTRWKGIAFSSEYYRSGQNVLVRRGDTSRNGGPITGMADLVGKKVCAPTGTTSMDKLRTFAGVVPVGADTHTGCLVLFQEGKVDAITGDATVLAGLVAQDPYARVVDAPPFTAEPYGLGFNAANVDFVSFVNGVLAQMRSDGRWTKSYNTWLAKALGPAPTPPVAVYGRTR
jgi:polar amino acid transport system substrate-binding protein